MEESQSHCPPTIRVRSVTLTLYLTLFPSSISNCQYTLGGGVITSVVYDWVNKVVIWLDSMLGLFVSSLDG